ncbi:hypothetical protein CI102_150 [Trichoderma harzianum]|nr:hypothetical protein CI102_150 [Trichoderma harzianum]
MYNIVTKICMIWRQVLGIIAPVYSAAKSSWNRCLGHIDCQRAAAFVTRGLAASKRTSKPLYQGRQAKDRSLREKRDRSAYLYGHNLTARDRRRYKLGSQVGFHMVELLGRQSSCSSPSPMNLVLMCGFLCWGPRGMKQNEVRAFWAQKRARPGDCCKVWAWLTMNALKWHLCLGS